MSYSLKKKRSYVIYIGHLVHLTFFEGTWSTWLNTWVFTIYRKKKYIEFTKSNL